MPDDTPATAPADTGITIVTGREGPVDATEPVTCSYCGLGIVADDDHVPTCVWRPGKAGAWRRRPKTTSGPRSGRCGCACPTSPN